MTFWLVSLLFINIFAYGNAYTYKLMNTFWNLLIVSYWPTKKAWCTVYCCYFLCNM